MEIKDEVVPFVAKRFRDTNAELESRVCDRGFGNGTFLVRREHGDTIVARADN